MALDVVKSNDIEATVEAVTQETGGTLIYLVVKTGRNHFIPVLDEDLDEVEALFEINSYGLIAVTQAFVPLLMKAKCLAVYVT